MTLFLIGGRLKTKKLSTTCLIHKDSELFLCCAVGVVCREVIFNIYPLTQGFHLILEWKTFRSLACSSWGCQSNLRCFPPPNMPPPVLVHLETQGADVPLVQHYRISNITMLLRNYLLCILASASQHSSEI